MLQAIFTCPLGYVYQIYNQANYQFPLEQAGSRVRIQKNDPRYNEILGTLPGAHIKPEIQEFLDNHNIRKDLIICEHSNGLGAIYACMGTNYFTKGDASILLTPGLYAADKDACFFTLKRAICQIKNNDTMIIKCVPFICCLAASIYGLYFLTFFPAVGLAVLVSTVTLSASKRWRDGIAFDFAIENSSNEELLGGRRLHIALQREIIEMRSSSCCTQILYSANGDPRIPILPSLSSRIQKIELALQARGVHIDIDAENLKLNGDLKNLFARILVRARA